MSYYYKKLLRNIFLLLTLLFVFISYIIYSTFEQYALEENAAKVQDLVMHNKALHTYVEETLKPVLYSFQKDGNISKDYFDPKVLSFTYISRHIMQEYNKQRALNNLPELVYKISSTNPRNSINLATKEESLLLEKFNHSDLKKYVQYINKENEFFTYYAMPVARNKESCMKCHSTPKAAPSDIAKIYGDTNGFYEKLGEIRAFISITMPLNIEISTMRELFLVILTALGTIFLTGLFTVYFFIKTLDKKDQKLRKQVKMDGLTKIYNRYKFNKDLEVYTTSKRNENIYLSMFDIDHFKSINDTYGHSAGDLVLKKLTQSVQNAMRPEDKFYRIGGEEFAIISFSHNDDAQKLFLQRIHQIIANIEFANMNSITVSIGYTKLLDNEPSKELYERCDKALYEAKNSGRNCIKSI